jgi:hypothetical protein
MVSVDVKGWAINTKVVKNGWPVQKLWHFIAQKSRKKIYILEFLLLFLI